MDNFIRITSIHNEHIRMIYVPTNATTAAATTYASSKENSKASWEEWLAWQDNKELWWNSTEYAW